MTSFEKVSKIYGSFRKLLWAQQKLTPIKYRVKLQKTRHENLWRGNLKFQFPRLTFPCLTFDRDLFQLRLTRAWHQRASPPQLGGEKKSIRFLSANNGDRCSFCMMYGCYLLAAV
jgi:hypothetical protein